MYLLNMSHLICIYAVGLNSILFVIKYMHIRFERGSDANANLIVISWNAVCNIS